MLADAQEMTLVLVPKTVCAHRFKIYRPFAVVRLDPGEESIRLKAFE